ncbi:hypothetical protein WA026_016987 [Henosepilachna vigintioctopunctata]|uniref:Uncharacterized protein n=1 Tax=Henosepilachna vigintioctopunctata TaxID=420089 RepID=A0AAW1U845_9CUCU
MCHPKRSCCNQGIFDLSDTEGVTPDVFDENYQDTGSEVDMSDIEMDFYDSEDYQVWESEDDFSFTGGVETYSPESPPPSERGLPVNMSVTEGDMDTYSPESPPPSERGYDFTFTGGLDTDSPESPPPSERGFPVNMSVSEGDMDAYSPESPPASERGFPVNVSGIEEDMDASYSENLGVSRIEVDLSDSEGEYVFEYEFSGIPESVVVDVSFTGCDVESFYSEISVVSGTEGVFTFSGGVDTVTPESPPP